MSEKDIKKYLIDNLCFGLDEFDKRFEKIGKFSTGERYDFVFDITEDKKLTHLEKRAVVDDLENIEKLTEEYKKLDNKYYHQVTKNLQNYKDSLTSFWIEIGHDRKDMKYDSDAMLAATQIAYKYRDNIVNIGIDKDLADRLISVTTGLSGHTLRSERDRVHQYATYEVLPLNTFSAEDHYKKTPVNIEQVLYRKLTSSEKEKS